MHTCVFFFTLALIVFQKQSDHFSYTTKWSLAKYFTKVSIIRNMCCELQESILFAIHNIITYNNLIS